MRMLQKNTFNCSINPDTARIKQDEPCAFLAKLRKYCDCIGVGHP